MTQALETISSQTPSDIELQEIELGHTEETDTIESIKERVTLAQALAARATRNTIPRPSEWGPAHHSDDYVRPEIPTPEGLNYSA